MVEITSMNRIANLAAVPALVRRALQRSLQRIAAALRLADNVRLVLWLARWQPIAKRMWLLHRAATCSNSGADSRRRTDKQERSQYNRRKVIAA
jgi:hypothetical protein